MADVDDGLNDQGNSPLKLIRGLLSVQRKQTRIIRRMIKEIAKISAYCTELETYLKKAQLPSKYRPGDPPLDLPEPPKPPDPPSSRLDGFWGNPN